MRWLKFSLLAVVLLVTAACAPVAQTIVDAIDNSDGATLTYVTQGIEFDPAGSLARGVVFRAEGDTLTLLGAPNHVTCSITGARLECFLGNVSEPMTINMTGTNIVANVTYRRVGSSKIYLTFVTGRL